jgi:hypothetical protein
LPTRLLQSVRALKGGLKVEWRQRVNGVVRGRGKVAGPGWARGLCGCARCREPMANARHTGLGERRFFSPIGVGRAAAADRLT